MDHLITEDIMKIRLNNRLIRIGLTPIKNKLYDITLPGWNIYNNNYPLYINIKLHLLSNTIYYCDICNNYSNQNIKLILKCKHHICLYCEQKLNPKRCPYCRVPIYDNLDIELYNPINNNIDTLQINTRELPFYGDIGICNYIYYILYYNIFNIIVSILFILISVFLLWTLYNHNISHNVSNNISKVKMSEISRSGVYSPITYIGV
tara:strand:+ start:298 stop:915 length:618 start_codon:yes stop_codon:yes gene_type:complete